MRERESLSDHRPSQVTQRRESRFDVGKQRLDLRPFVGADASRRRMRMRACGDFARARDSLRIALPNRRRHAQHADFDERRESGDLLRRATETRERMIEQRCDGDRVEMLRADRRDKPRERADAGRGE